MVRLARGKYRRKRLRKQRRKLLLCETSMSVRVVHILEKEGIKTLTDLDLCSHERLASIAGIGEAAMQEIMEYRLDL